VAGVLTLLACASGPSGPGESIAEAVMPVLLPTVPVLAGIGYLHGHPGDVAEEKLQPERDRYHADHQPGPGLK